MAQLKWMIFLTLLIYQTSIRAQKIPEKRIVNGFHAVPKQFPYIVNIKFRENCQTSALCGGVIISDRIVLTAAHCITNTADACIIFFGTVDKSNNMEMGQQRLTVKRKNIVVHPEYDETQFVNDIAVIRLPAQLEFDEFIQPAKLPDPDNLYENESAVVSGWGWITGNRTTTDQLMYYNATVFSNEECKNTIIGTFFPSSYICLKPSQSSPCYGDSGGPLAIRNEDGTSTFLGIASFIILAECPIYSPAVYTRVSSFLQWIKQHESL